MSFLFFTDVTECTRQVKCPYEMKTSKVNVCSYIVKNLVNVRGFYFMHTTACRDPGKHLVLMGNRCSFLAVLPIAPACATPPRNPEQPHAPGEHGNTVQSPCAKVPKR